MKLSFVEKVFEFINRPGTGHHLLGTSGKSRTNRGYGHGWYPSKDCQLTHLSLIQIYYPDKATEPPLDVEKLKAKKEIEKLKRANIEVVEREPIRKVSFQRQHLCW